MNFSRRSMLRNLSVATGSVFLGGRSFAIPAAAAPSARSIKIGMISDLHHLQFGKNEETRMKAFMDAVEKQSPDFIIQCGDFCRPVGSDGIMREWNRFKGPKYHVLGNHDMDVCDKQTIMKLWGMQSPYYSFDTGGFHFVIMDRNFFKKDDGSLADYNTSNWPVTSSARSFSDAAQLQWLKQDLAKTNAPVIVFMHQPVFVSDFFEEIGNADEILSIFDEANFTARQNGKPPKIAAVFMGHDHDDRYGERNGVHYFILNSASYVYKDKPWYYKDCLYSFLTLHPSGKLIIHGTQTSFASETPENIRASFPTRISDRQVNI